MSTLQKSLDRDAVQALPKVHLHDHLDGGLRPQTIIDLAPAAGVELASDNPEELQKWFHRGADRGSLPLYLEGFAITCGVMQTEESLRRVAREKAQDLAADGVVYSEVRFAPILHVNEGLNLEQVMNAVLAGLAEGCEGTNLETRVIVCSLRNMDARLSLEAAELAVNYRDRGVVGFDLAGDESGHPPKAHLEAFQYLLRQNFNITIHAGEAFGLSSIWQAIQYCGAHRIGHAPRLDEDIIDTEGSESKGTLAQYILDKRIPLEMCLSSNVHTGAIDKLENHPFPRYFREGFRVALNVDNYLMSATTLTDEWMIAQDLFGLDLDDMERLAIDGAKSSFLHHHHVEQLIHSKILPAYVLARHEGQSLR